MLIALLLWLIVPALQKTGAADKNICANKPDKKHIILAAVLLAVSVGIIFAYVYWLAPWLSAHNIKLL